MVSFKQILLVSVLVAATYTKISVRDGLPHFQLLRDDVADFDLKSVFDLSQSNGDVSFSANVGRTFSYGEPFAMKNYDILGVEKPNFIRAHDNWVVAVYDDTTVVFQAIDTNGKRFLHYQSVDLKKFGANLVCTGTAFNKSRMFMYIGCFDKTSTELKPGSMYIFTWDFQKGEIVNEVSVKQDDGFRVINTLNLFIESFPQEGNDDQVYLLAYDQGHTIQTETRMSNHARVFFNIESGKLEFDTLVEVSMKGEEYDIIYDMFPYQNTLILSGRIKGVGSIVTLAQCKLDLTDNQIVCNPKYKPTQITSGTVQVHSHDMTYHMLDIETKEISYYQISGAFTSATWNTKLLGKMTVDMPALDEQHIWIKGIHTSQWGGVIYYGSVTHQDPGVTYVDWSSKWSMYDSHQTATIYDRDWVVQGVHATSQTLMLIRDEPLYLIEGGYYTGRNEITLTATDKDGSISTHGAVSVHEHIFESIHIENRIGTIELLSKESKLFSFNHKDIHDGNGLNVEVKTADESLLKATAYTHAPMRISWKGQKTAVVGDYAFSHDKVVVVDAANTMRWGSCTEVSANPITIICEQLGSHALTRANKLNSKIVTHQDLTMSWSTNTDAETSVIYFTDDEGDFIHHNFKGIIHDAGFMKTKDFYYAFVVFDQDRVEIWSLNPNDLKEFEKYLILDKTNVTFNGFCPTAVSIPPHSNNEYDILSDCGFNGKAVLRMGLTYNTEHFNIPLSMRDSTKGFCTFHREFVIDTQDALFSLAGNDTFNYWTVPIDELDGGLAYDMFCLPTLHKVAYVAYGTKGLKHTLITQNAIEGAIHQGRRFPTHVDGIEAETIRAYELLDRIVFVVENMGQTTFLTTYDTPRIKFNAGHVDDEEDVLVTITVYNRGSEQTFVQLATIYPIDE